LNNKYNHIYIYILSSILYIYNDTDTYTYIHPYVVSNIFQLQFVYSSYLVTNEWQEVKEDYTVNFKCYITEVQQWIQLDAAMIIY